MSNRTGSEQTGVVKLDLGCGKRKTTGFTGVDRLEFDGVDVVFDLMSSSWPWGDDSVDEVQCSHVVEHFTPEERIWFANELFRVLKPGARAVITTPHWASMRAYGDLTHQWPPVCEFWYLYLNKQWRSTEAPHESRYTCDFDHTPGYGVNPKLNFRNEEFKHFALEFYRESAMDLIVTVTKPLKPR